MLRILFCFFAALIPVLDLAAEDVTPLQRFQLNYPLSDVRLSYAAGDELNSLDVHEGQVYVPIESGGQRHIIALPLDTLQQSMIALVKNGTVEFLAPYATEPDKGYVLFLPGTIYAVARREGDQLFIEREFAGKARDLKLPARLFGPPEVVPKPTMVLRQQADESVAVTTVHRSSADTLALLKERYALASVPSPEKPEDAVCLFEDRDGRGTGFLFYESGNLYCYTNIHIIEGMVRPTIRTLGGAKVEFVAVEVAEDRDLARLLVTTPLPALQASAAPTLREAISVLGNSQGAGRVTVLKGIVNGLNTAEVEITAGIVPGNSGSPILNARNEVVGVAAYMQEIPMPEKFTRGTDFAKARRVGVRIDPAPQWVEADLSRMQRLASVYHDMEQFVEEAGEVIKRMAESPEAYLSPLQLQNTVLRDWAVRRNEFVKQRRASLSSEMTYEDYITYVRRAVQEQFDHHRYLSSLLSTRSARLRSMHMVPDTHYNRARVEQLLTVYTQLLAANQELLEEIQRYMQ